MGTTTVVITCFELGTFLAEAVDSVLRQTRPVDELIVVDDGSTDALTERALAACAAQGICVVRARHRGVAEARNTGIELAGADYIVLLDADDTLEPTLVEHMAGVLDSQPGIGFVTCGVQAFGDASYVWVPPPCTAQAALVRGGPHVSSMFRRHLWQDAGRFDGSLEGYEDTDFWVRVMSAGVSGCVLERPLLRYRVRKGSRYSHALLDDRFMRIRARLREKHATLASSPDVLLDLFAFVAEQRAHATALATRGRQQAAEAERLMGEVNSVRDDVLKAGADPDWGDLERAEPISAFWGFDRGTPVDRFYIESFLRAHAVDIRGHVVEVKDDGYTRRFGRDLTSVDVIDIDPTNPHATIVADLTRTDTVPEALADCVILTQTLHLLFDIPAAIASAARLLKPGGVLLCTIPCVSRVSAESAVHEADCWRLTPSAVEELFWRAFPSGQVEVTALGNLKTCTAFLHGVAAEELSAEDLGAHDPSCPLLCTVRVTGARADRLVPFTPEHAHAAGAVLLYHRIGAFEPDVHAISRRMDALAADLDWLCASCQVMPLVELVQAARLGTLPPRAVSLTFDDGYVEHLEAVAPLLVDLGLPATFFVNTALLERPSEQWWDEVERIFLVDGERAQHRGLDCSTVGGTVIPVTDARSRREAHDQVFALMYRQSATERARTMQLLRGWHGGQLAPRPPYTVLTSSQLRSLAGLPGMTIGAHSMNHLAMPLHEPGTQVFEAASCKRALEDLLQRPVDTFAYPYGVHDAGTMANVGQAGFSLAVTVEPNPVRCGALPLRIPRFEVAGAATARALVLSATGQAGRG